MGIIQAAIPLFFLVAADLLWSRMTGRRGLRLNDSLADLSCGILSQLAGVFTKLFMVGTMLGAVWTTDAAPLIRC